MIDNILNLIASKNNDINTISVETYVIEVGGGKYVSGPPSLTDQLYEKILGSIFKKI